MLQSVISNQTNSEGKFSNFFQLAKGENIREQKMEEYGNKLKSQMQDEINENRNQNNKK